uniref:Uncharacterized protein n=1 Tax=Schistosoma haematobium TaxID=6185 RepID=A0A095C5A9_SCHHA
MSEINANIQSNNNNILIILVGNKLDEEKNRMVTKKEGERLAQVIVRKVTYNTLSYLYMYNS